MDEQSATLRRAIEALNSVCLKPPERPSPSLENKLGTRATALPSDPDLGASVNHSAAQGIPPVDPVEWREPFARWLDCDCVRDPRCSGGVGCLHIAFCEWAVGQDDVPCNRFVFECLLREAGFRTDEVAGVVLVSGLILLGDFNATER